MNLFGLIEIIEKSFANELKIVCILPRVNLFGVMYLEQGLASLPSHLISRHPESGLAKAVQLATSVS